VSNENELLGGIAPEHFAALAENLRKVHSGGVVDSRVLEAANVLADLARRPILSDEAVERAAKGMCAAAHPRLDPDAMMPAQRGQSGMMPKWRLYEHLARAALTAALSSPPEPVPSSPVGIAALLDAYDAETRKLPLGHETPRLGTSTYNWRRSVVDDLRKLAGLPLPAAPAHREVGE
jgi:hypothetical protein